MAPRRHTALSVCSSRSPQSSSQSETVLYLAFLALQKVLVRPVFQPSPKGLVRLERAPGGAWRGIF